MNRRRLVWLYLPALLLLFACALAAVTWYASVVLKQSHLDRIKSDLESRAETIAARISPLIAQADSAATGRMSEELGFLRPMRSIVIKSDDRIVGDTTGTGINAETEAIEPEIVAARNGRTGVKVRFNRAAQQDVMSVAVPIRGGDRVPSVVCVLAPIGYIDELVGKFLARVIVIDLLTLVIFAAVVVYVFRRLSRTMALMREGVERFAQLDFSARIPGSGPEELTELAHALNRMGAQISEQVRNLAQQKTEEDAILVSMIEGVLAVDTEERLLNLNQAAAKLLDVSAEAVRGRMVQEVIRNTDLLEFLSRALESQSSVEGDVVLNERNDTVIQVHGTPLHDSRGKGIGALLVFHDITQLRRLENMRRDFVANVSHELRTPITSIQGFAETLQDGALEDPTEARRFVGIIAHHADRLNNLIEDLLALSRIEQEAERHEIHLEAGPVGPVIAHAVESCRSRARERSISIEVTPSDDLKVRMRADLLEQAVVNLLDNAIKYSESGKTIRVEMHADASEVTIAVQDEGIGIEKEYIPRLWERFYRIDKSRSRAQGGTGLGLAIVKHIVLAHGGRVSVDSTPGAGSTFRIHLPLR